MSRTRSPCTAYKMEAERRDQVRVDDSLESMRFIKSCGQIGCIYKSNNAIVVRIGVIFI